jgi:alanine racemase
MSMATSPFRSCVEISRSQIAANFREIKTAVGPDIEVMPVIKADAYRHGAIEVARTLTAEGARWLAVSNVEEGVALRQAGVDTRIVVMADFLPAGRVSLVQHDLTPVIHSLDDLKDLHLLSLGRETPLRYHLKIDSGMCRLGTKSCAEDIARAVQALSGIQIEGLMTHFASVADFTVDQTETQTQAFFHLREDLKRLGVDPPIIHLSSTGSIAYRGREAWGNMVRPGISIYGYVSPARGPAPQNILKVQPALTWKAAVLTVKDIPEGAQVGYGGMFRAPHPMRIAVLAVGYADGLPHRLSNKGRVIACGRYANILGAVSMDVTTIDVTDCPEIRTGDAVTILGSEGGLRIDAQDIARLAGTISYSVLCGISSRVRRVYV